MKNLAAIDNNLDITTKEYVDAAIPTVPTISLNGSTTISPSFYAPTSAGTSGYYLKSNGSGAPIWASLPSGGVTDVTVNGNSVVSSNVAALTVATNWVNGSATGSVRTSGSTPESESYTMGYYALAEGSATSATSYAAHAEGFNTSATGASSHSEGNVTWASGNYSHASGNHTTAQRQSQTAIGEYNILDTAGSTTTRGDYAFIIGNGDSTTRSNALTVDWNGNLDVAGSLTTGSNIKLPNHITLQGAVNDVIRPTGTTEDFIDIVEVNENNNVVLGYYPSYTTSGEDYNTHIYGNTIRLNARSNVVLPLGMDKGIQFGSGTAGLFGGAVSGNGDRLYLAGDRVMFRSSAGDSYSTLAQITPNGIISSTHATGSDSAAIGYTTYKESTTSQSLTSDTVKTLLSTILAAGQWIVVGTARFTGGSSSGNTGVKALGISTGTSSLTTSTPGHMRVYATANWTQVLATTRILDLDASTTVTLQGLSTQNTPGSVPFCTMHWIRVA